MITSVSNPKVKNLIQLQKKGKVRREKQSFVVEGIKMVMEAPNERLREIYVSEAFMQNGEHRMKAEKKAEETGCLFEILSDKVFKEASDTLTPQGIMAVVDMKVFEWKDFLSVQDKKMLLILESLQDPGNLGTILRTGEGAGIHGVILNRTSVDPFMPKVIRSTMGSIYRVPVAIADDLTQVVHAMRHLNMHVYAAHLKGEKSYFEQDYCSDICFMIGNEANGLSDELADLATDYIRIPMSGQVESLNAGVAAALLMYEAKRQRMHN